MTHNGEIAQVFKKGYGGLNIYESSGTLLKLDKYQFPSVLVPGCFKT